MSVTERIRQYIEYKGISVRQFSKQAGLSNGFLGKVSDVGSTKLSNIVEAFPELSLEWLVTGKGEMVRINDKPLSKDYQMVPLVDIEVIGGYVGSTFRIEEENIIGYFPVNNYGLAKVDFSVTIKGESMWPRYCGGDKVDCKIIRKEDYIQWNRIYVISTLTQGLLLKRIRRGSTEKSILLVSDNPTYESFEVLIEEVFGMALVLGGQKVEW